MSLSQCHIRFLADNKSYESTSNRCGFVQKKKANISAFLVTRILTPMKALSSGVGWGGATTLMFTCTHRIGYIMISSLTLAHGRDATLSYDLLHLHNLAHALDATLLYLLWDRTYQWIFTHSLAK